MPDDGLTHTLYVVGDLSFVAALEMIQPHATLIAHQDHERDTMALMIDKGRRQQIAEDVWQEALPGIPILPDFEAISAWLAGNYTS